MCGYYRGLLLKGRGSAGQFSNRSIALNLIKPDKGICLFLKGYALLLRLFGEQKKSLCPLWTRNCRILECFLMEGPLVISTKVTSRALNLQG